MIKYAYLNITYPFSPISSNIAEATTDENSLRLGAAILNLQLGYRNHVI